jgi:hypothetical protein
MCACSLYFDFETNHVGYTLSHKHTHTHTWHRSHYHTLTCTRHDRLKAAKALLRRGADLNHCNKQGLGALHVSAGAGHVELAEYLSEKMHVQLLYWGIRIVSLAQPAKYHKHTPHEYHKNVVPCLQQMNFSHLVCKKSKACTQTRPLLEYGQMQAERMHMSHFHVRTSPCKVHAHIYKDKLQCESMSVAYISKYVRGTYQ